MIHDRHFTRHFPGFQDHNGVGHELVQVNTQTTGQEQVDEATRLPRRDQYVVFFLLFYRTLFEHIHNVLKIDAS